MSCSNTENQKADISPISLRIEEENLKKRRIFLWSQVDEASSKYIVDRLFYLDSLSPGQEITLMVNSPGGINTHGFAILDTMELIASPVATLCTGLAASFGALILLCGNPGRRSATPGARIMLHQPWIPGEIKAVATDLFIQAKEIKKQKEEINRLIAKRCSRSFEKVEKDTDRDMWMTAKEALEYGVVDFITERL
jgi:ATP-dependent Clp protease, protease subunit